MTDENGEYMASTVIVDFFYCNYEFQHAKLCSFQTLTLSLRLILKTFYYFFSNFTLDVLIQYILRKKSVGEELVYRRRDFNLLPVNEVIGSLIHMSIRSFPFLSFFSCKQEFFTILSCVPTKEQKARKARCGAKLDALNPFSIA